MPVGMSEFLTASLFLSHTRTLTHTETHTHTHTHPQTRTASAPSLRVSQSSPSPLSLLPLTPSPLSPHSLYPIAPASCSTFATSALPSLTAICSGVFPFCNEEQAVSAQASCVLHATNSKAPPPPTLRRSRYLNCLLRWCCSALPPHALHPPPTDHPGCAPARI